MERRLLERRKKRHAHVAIVMMALNSLDLETTFTAMNVVCR